MVGAAGSDGCPGVWLLEDCSYSASSQSLPVVLLLCARVEKARLKNMSGMG